MSIWGLFLIFAGLSKIATRGKRKWGNAEVETANEFSNKGSSEQQKPLMQLVRAAWRHSELITSLSDVLGCRF